MTFDIDIDDIIAYITKAYGFLRLATLTIWIVYSLD